MATIATLATIFTGEGSSFTKTADAVDKKLGVLVKDAKAFSSLIKGVLVGALAAVGVSMSVGFVKSILATVSANYKLARSIGDTTSGIYALQQGLRDAGADTSILSDVLLRLVKNLASVSGGNSAYAEALERIGLSARELSKLPPSKALQAIAEQISKIENAEGRASIAVQLFGDHAAELLPLLVQGGKAFDEAAEKARKMGLAIGDADAANLEEMRIKTENVKAAFEGVVLQLGQKFLPYIIKILDNLPPVETWFNKINDSINDNTVGLRKLIGFFTALGAIGNIISIGVQNAFLALGKAVTFTLKQILGFEKAMSKLTGIKSPQWMNDMYDDLTNIDEAIADNIRKNNSAIDANIKKLNNAHNVNLAPFEAIEKAAEIAGNKIHKKLTAAGSVKIAVAQADNFAKGLDIFNESKTPIDLFNDRMTQLNDLIDKGAISWDTYARASGEALNKLEKAHEMNKMGFAAGVRGGTTEAATTLLQHEQEVTLKSRNDPQKRVENAINTGNTIAKQQLDVLKKIAAPLEDITKVKIGRNP